MEKNRLRITSLVTSIGLALSLSSFAQTEIRSIDFKVEGGVSEVQITGAAPLIYDRQTESEENQVILDISGARLGSMASRKLDTSSFESPVTLISPYLIGNGEEKQVRVVVQLREPVEPSISAEGNRIVIRIGGGAKNVAASTTVEETTPVEPETDEEKEAQTNLDGFMESRVSKNFQGTPVTLQVRDADVQDVLRLISEASGFNIVLGPGVKGKITLSLVEVPWDQALDVILHTLKLGAERNHNVLRILTLTNLTAEKKQELAAKQASEATAPQITRVFPVSYADLSELSKILGTFRKSSTTGLVNGTIEIDKRTNSIIVQDIKENLDRMGKLLELLDTQTPQVLIESKIVEATETSALNIAGSIGMAQTAGIAAGDTGQYFAGFAGANPVDNLIGTANDTNAPIFTGSAIAQTTSSGGAGAIQPTLGFLPGAAKLTAVLQLGESESTLKVVSSPKTVVINKETAKILQSIPVLIKTTTIAETGQFIEASEIQDANISLEVTPTVTNDENVLMDLKISRDVPQAPSGGVTDAAIGRRSIDTKVLVDSGTTLVIGGIYVQDQSESSSGFPLLKDIPILGVFFGSQNDITTRSELFIFVTPKILNVRKAGLTT